VILDETVLSSEPLGTGTVITLGRSIKLVVEVVSTNWETDYARKVEEYALLGIPEYWIVDYRGLAALPSLVNPSNPPSAFANSWAKEYQQRHIDWVNRLLSPSAQSPTRLDDTPSIKGSVIDYCADRNWGLLSIY